MPRLWTLLHSTVNVISQFMASPSIFHAGQDYAEQSVSVPSPRQAAASVLGFVFLFTLEYESFVSKKNDYA
jgi:hypothetical protein